VIFVTPTLVHTPEDTEYLLQEELARRGRRLKDEVDALLQGSSTSQK
jgi:hypothetical protein